MGVWECDGAGPHHVLPALLSVPLTLLQPQGLALLLRLLLRLQASQGRQGCRECSITRACFRVLEHVPTGKLGSD